MIFLADQSIVTLCWTADRSLAIARRSRLRARCAFSRNVRLLELKTPSRLRLPANQVLQRRIGHFLRDRLETAQKRELAYFDLAIIGLAFADPGARELLALDEWHQAALPRLVFIVTNLIRPNKRVVKFYNGRGTTEQ